ncbi:DedA family protein [Knoellia subterranea]|uniref:Membrane protein n=1 Tax=Knoellia subterranea KCTC 19937 TaxID=1385521 RepID=A0A0A0JJ40_9MICO|nr:VTT domain-containing protein [Knoellia subterranea]KGN37098.1 membrane protein [Knoellia subterranea KCTC 19937]
MVEAINGFIELHAGAPWLVPALFVFFAVDGILPPLPSEGVLVGLAAVGASTGTPHWLALFVAAAAGAWVGDNLAYLLGRHGRLDRLVARSTRGARALEWARRNFERRGALIVVLGRWIPVGRAAVNLTAGATAFSHRRFASWTVLSGSLWAAWSVGLGTLAGHWVESNALLAACLGIALALVVAVAVERVVRRLAPPAPVT